jgi:hypothetical protein
MNFYARAFRPLPSFAARCSEMIPLRYRFCATADEIRFLRLLSGNSNLLFQRPYNRHSRSAIHASII